MSRAFLRLEVLRLAMKEISDGELLKGFPQSSPKRSS